MARSCHVALMVRYGKTGNVAGSLSHCAWVGWGLFRVADDGGDTIKYLMFGMGPYRSMGLRVTGMDVTGGRGIRAYGDRL